VPKQIKDKNKSTRMKYALDAIESYGRCSHKEITEFVAKKIDANQKLPSFKKAIHNDIKDLIKDHHICVEYFTPAGEPIPIGEEDIHKNKRTQYFIIGGESQIKGGSLLNNVGAFFRPQRISSPSWQITNAKNKNTPQKKQLCILFRINNKSFSLETDKDQLPFKIVIARKDHYIPSDVEIEREFGSRASLLLLPWQFISSPKSNDKLGHFVISFNEFEDKVQVVVTFIQGKTEDSDIFLKKQGNISVREVTYHTISNFFGRSQNPTTDIADSFVEDNRISDEPNKWIPLNISIGKSTFKPVSIDIGHRFQILIAELDKQCPKSLKNAS